MFNNKYHKDLSDLMMNEHTVDNILPVTKEGDGICLNRTYMEGPKKIQGWNVIYLSNEKIQYRDSQGNTIHEFQLDSLKKLTLRAFPLFDGQGPGGRPIDIGHTGFDLIAKGKKVRVPSVILWREDTPEGVEILLKLLTSTMNEQKLDKLADSSEYKTWAKMVGFQ